MWTCRTELARRPVLRGRGWFVPGHGALSCRARCGSLRRPSIATLGPARPSGQYPSRRQTVLVIWPGRRRTDRAGDTAGALCQPPPPTCPAALDVGGIGERWEAEIHRYTPKYGPSVCWTELFTCGDYLDTVPDKLGRIWLSEDHAEYGLTNSIKKVS